SERIDDPPALCYREIGALANHRRPDFVAVDPYRVVGTIPDLRIALIGRFDKCSDPAEPQKIDRYHQQPPDQLGRGQAIFLDVQGTLHSRADRDRFGTALEDAPASRDQGTVVILPARTRQSEETLPLEEALFRIGIGIDKDVEVVKRAEQPQ